MYELYVVTDRGLSKGRSHEEVAERSFRGGADVVQLRDKQMGTLDYYMTAVRIRALAKEYGRIFIVNDRVDIALASDADGVHIGQSDIPAKAVRRMVPEDFIIGVSVGNVTEARNAEKAGADYVALSPIFDTGTKEDAGSGRGMEMLVKIRSAVKIPVLAIGGIGKDNVSGIIKAGADGVAVISAVVSQDDITAAVRELKDLISKSKRD